jgi:hypothetical protein
MAAFTPFDRRWLISVSTPSTSSVGVITANGDMTATVGFLRAMFAKLNGNAVSSGTAGRVARRVRAQDGFDTQSLNAFSAFHDTRRRIPPRPE